MFFTSSILLILLCVFAGLYARSSQQEPALPPPVPKIPKNHTKKQISCLEPNCIITAALILQDIDEELDPCDDFYAYACHKWQESHAIPDTKSTIDVPSLLTASIRRRLNQILNRDFDSSSHNLLPDPNTILDRQLFSKLQDFYTSCMDQDTIEEKSVAPLYPLFRAIRDYIPLDNSMDGGGLNAALQYLADQNMWPLFQLKLEPDVLSDPSKPALYLYGGQVGLHDTYDDPETMRVYMQVVTSTLDIVFKRDTEFGWKSWSTVATARRIIEFEKKIAASYSTQQQQPERWSIIQLQDKLPHIDWHHFIQDLPEPPTHILVPHPALLDNLNNVVFRDMNPRTLQMYLIWRVLWTHVHVLSEEFVAQKRKLDAKTSGIEQRATPERWETCVDLLDQSAMGVLLGRYFVTDHPQMTRAKKVVEDLAQRVKTTLEQRVSNLTWIDGDTSRTEILKKLKSMEFQVGFSTLQPDVRSVISLSEYFGDITVDKKDFFGNIIISNRHQVRHQLWEALEEKRFDWSAWNAQSVRVSYNKELNKVMIPGGLLQAPFMDTEGPAYLYYGTIGWMIGHEITHGFDKVGRQYNHKGLFGSWWDERTRKNLDSQNQCLVSQYKALGVDGIATLNNNFADVGGVSVMESLLFSPAFITLPGLKGWTKDQLAYIQFARMKCSKSTKEHEKLNKHYAPDRLRVNGPLINSNHFSSSFGCKVGSFMNPDVKKCQVW
ncbi:unnamed protein product [Mucor hiemalis]